MTPVVAGQPSVSRGLRHGKAAEMTQPLTGFGDGPTVVIPAFNEERSISGVIGAVRQAVPGARILVVDDGSTDATAERAAAAGADVISHPLNKGNGACIKTALRSVEGGIVAIIDADGQHDPAGLPGLLAPLDRFDLVVGTRTFRNGEGTPLRNTGNILLGRLASFLAEQRIPDLTSGFRAFRHEIAAKFVHIYPNGYSFPATSTLSFIGAGHNVGFVPMNVKPRPIGSNSKLRPFREGFFFLMLILRVVTMVNPNKIFFPVGLLMVAAGLLLTIRNLILFAAFSGGTVLFLAGGINIIFFGLLLDQLASLRLKERE